MSQAMETLKAKLKQFEESLKFLRNAINHRSIEEDRDKLEENLRVLKTLTGEIPNKFAQSGYTRDERLRLQSFEKTYKQVMMCLLKLVDIYLQLLTEYKEMTAEDIVVLRRTYTQSNLAKAMKGQGRQKDRHRADSDEESEQQPKIQMQQVNTEVLHYERMIEQKEKELRQIDANMKNVLKVQQEMGTLVHEQGKRLDVVEVNIDKALSNVRDVEQNLIDAKDNHIAANKKKVCIFVIVLVVILIIVVPILIKFI